MSLILDPRRSTPIGREFERAEFVAENKKYRSRYLAITESNLGFQKVKFFPNAQNIHRFFYSIEKLIYKNDFNKWNSSQITIRVLGTEEERKSAVQNILQNTSIATTPLAQIIVDYTGDYKSSRIISN